MNRLFRDGVWTGSAVVITAVLSVALLPLFIRNFGTGGAGIVFGVQAILGASSMLDLGIGRAVTRAIAMDSASAGLGSWSASAVAGFRMSCVLGALVCVVGFVCGWVFDLRLSLEALKGLDRSEAFALCLLTGLGLGAAIVGNSFKGACEATRRFRSVAQVRIVVGVLSIGLPVLLSSWTQSVVVATAVIAGVRVLGSVSYACICRSVWIGGLFEGIGSKYYLRLLSLGSWLVLTALANLVFTMLDRFVVAKYFAAEDLTYYSAPVEVISKLSILTGVLATVLFPRFSRAFAARHFDDGRVLLWYGVLAAFLVVAFPSIFLFIFAENLLAVGFGEQFNDVSVDVAQIILVGAACNAMAVVPSGFLVAYGYARHVALFHLIQIVPFIGLMFVFAASGSLTGVASVWSLRMIVDAGFISLAAFGIALRSRRVSSC